MPSMEHANVLQLSSFVSFVTETVIDPLMQQCSEFNDIVWLCYSFKYRKIGSGHDSDNWDFVSSLGALPDVWKS